MISIKGGWIGALVDTSENVKHYYNIFIAVVFFFVAQLLICAWNQPFWSAGLEFPGQIVAMVFVWLTIWALQLLLYDPGQGLDKFYRRFLRAPTEILNKHMSIGFTVPFLNLIGHSVANNNQVGLLVAAFVVTGVLNSMLVYVVACHVQLAATKIARCLRCSPVPDIEAARTQTYISGHDPPQMNFRTEAPRHGGGSTHSDLGRIAEEDRRRQRSRKHISDTSTLCTMSGDMNELNGPETAHNGQPRSVKKVQDGHCRPGDGQQQLRGGHRAPNIATERAALSPSPFNAVFAVVFIWLSQNILLTISLLSLLLVGLPVSFLQRNDIYTDMSFLFTIWLTFSSAQLRTKQLASQGHNRRRALTAAATLLNPVLWTSLSLVCYGITKSSIRHQSSAAVIAGFSTKNTVSDIIANHVNIRPTAAGDDEFRPGSVPIGAGDVATSILNAGIVSWGLKLFEYRHQIVSSGGLTVVVTCLLASVLNIVAWPTLAHALGVVPASWSLSFAARSATIALGGPAMKSLGGDAGINAVGVVVNGICFQLVAGFLAPGHIFAAGAGRSEEAPIHNGWTGFVWNDRAHEHHELDSLAPTPVRGEVAGIVQRDEEPQPSSDRDVRYSSDATHIGERRPEDEDDAAPWGPTGVTLKNNDHSTGANMDSQPTHSDDQAQAHGDVSPDALSVVPTVAAGVTVGINAAAMGTAHLYEQNSRAAPYSALSMTMFGVFTVLFTIRGPLTEWLVRTVGGEEAQAVMML
ncbi:hypothetical protein KVR01_004623 [Diaporthe batatas]|uniref:uncharacterized protein n=1 Tax=Diaporthe batatas TaxID=748121 RepID=UPI001D0376DB|nr:uncharacterized protein KVR01_004623 [Diaporthe batatas]KAG8166071.1 hypothetical protein KVR01_004623 [Diaporthe batatas]